MGSNLPDYRMIGGVTQHTVGSSAYTFPNKPRDAKGMMIESKTADIDLTTDGSTPSATAGMRIIHDQAAVYVPLTNLSIVKGIRDASTDADVRFWFVK